MHGAAIDGLIVGEDIGQVAEDLHSLLVWLVVLHKNSLLSGTT